MPRLEPLERAGANTCGRRGLPGPEWLHFFDGARSEESWMMTIWENLLTIIFIDPNSLPCAHSTLPPQPRSSLACAPLAACNVDIRHALRENEADGAAPIPIAHRHARRQHAARSHSPASTQLAACGPRRIVLPHARALAALGAARAVPQRLARRWSRSWPAWVRLLHSNHRLPDDSSLLAPSKK